MTEPIIPLIMCGGAGTRSWPASREGRPKQFLRSSRPALDVSETIRRVSEPAVFARPMVVTNHQYRFLVAEQLAEIGVDADILLEPHRRDSAPAIAAGAVHALRRSEAPIVLALAADHVVTECRGVRGGLPRCAPRRGERTYRDVRRHAGSARNRIRLYPSRQELGRRRLCRGEIRRRSPTKRRRARISRMGICGTPAI